jgi:hypothetical protein
MYLGELALDLDISLGTINITQACVDWCNGGTSINHMLETGYIYHTNGDSMFHVNKGVIGYRFGGVKGLEMDKCSLDNVSNTGLLGNESLVPYAIHGDTKYYLGAQTFGVTLSYCKEVKIHNSKFKDIRSENGDATGISVMNKSSRIKLYNLGISKLRAGLHDEKRKCYGISYYGEPTSYTHLKRNRRPWAVGIKVSDSCDTDINCVNIYSLKSCKKPEKITYVK